MLTAGSRSLQPHRLREGAVGGDVPDFEADPAAAGELGRERERAAAEGGGVGQVDPLAIDLLAVAGDDLGEGEREGPCEVGEQLGLAVGGAA